MKRIAKKDKGDRKAALELPGASIPAQQQAKLASRQEGKKAKEVSTCKSLLCWSCRLHCSQRIVTTQDSTVLLQPHPACIPQGVRAFAYFAYKIDSHLYLVRLTKGCGRAAGEEAV